MAEKIYLKSFEKIENNKATKNYYNSKAQNKGPKKSHALNNIISCTCDHDHHH